jgi:hypothetical protein
MGLGQDVELLLEGQVVDLGVVHLLELLLLDGVLQHGLGIPLLLEALLLLHHIALAAEDATQLRLPRLLHVASADHRLLVVDLRTTRTHRHRV